MGDFLSGPLLGVIAGFCAGTAFWKYFVPKWFK
jgi:hypothetical protein